MTSRRLTVKRVFRWIGLTLMGCGMLAVLYGVFVLVDSADAEEGLASMLGLFLVCVGALMTLIGWACATPLRSRRQD